MRPFRTIFALAIALVAAPSLASNISGGGGGGTVPGSACGDSTHAIGWSGSAYTCQAITGSATPGGASGQLQYNNAGALGGIAGATTNGTGVTFASGDLVAQGATSGTLTINCAAVCGTGSVLTLPGGTTNFSATGGASQVLEQTSAGGAFTVARLACADLSNATAACSTAIGASGGAIPLLNANNTWSGVQSHNAGDLVVNGSTLGALTINCAAVCGANTITFPAGTTNFSATGGTSQVLEQTSAGGAITVARLQCADLSNAGTGCSGTLPVSANPTATIGLSAVNGTATTFMTSDSAPALSQAIAPTWTGAHTFSGKPVTLSGNQSVAAWSTNGTGLVQAAATYTDTSTAASGTVATSYVNKLGVPTIAASNTGVAYTNTYTVDVETPTNGTNVTITNPWSALFNSTANLTGGVVISADGAIAPCGGATPQNGFNLCMSGNSYAGIIDNAGAGFGLRVVGQGTGSQDILLAQSNNGSNSIIDALDNGLVEMPEPVSIGTKPALTGTCTTSGITGGATAGKFTATCASQTVIITFATAAPNGWTCDAQDTTTSTDSLKQTASATTSCTLTGTTASSDTVVYHAVGW